MLRRWNQVVKIKLENGYLLVKWPLEYINVVVSKHTPGTIAKRNHHHHRKPLFAHNRNVNRKACRCPCTNQQVIKSEALKKVVKHYSALKNIVKVKFECLVHRDINRGQLEMSHKTASSVVGLCVGIWPYSFGIFSQWTFLMQSSRPIAGILIFSIFIAVGRCWLVWCICNANAGLFFEK